MSTELPKDISTTVSQALEEDIGSGDITGQLIPNKATATAKVITRENATLCGIAWFNEVYRQVNSDITILWNVQDGDTVNPEQTLCTLTGPTRSILTGERCALNFLQTLSGTATLANAYAEKVKHHPIRLLDTRKTIPGLRTAQKYAIRCGGCENHRMGLFDAFLIKENHIAACGSIIHAVNLARQYASNKLLEVEVENLEELNEALAAKVDRIMLDNFSIEEIKTAVKITNYQTKLELSGNITLDNILEFAATGVDYISIGALTKDCKAIDLSLQLTETK